MLGAALTFLTGAGLAAAALLAVVARDGAAR